MWEGGVWLGFCVGSGLSCLPCLHYTEQWGPPPPLPLPPPHNVRPGFEGLDLGPLPHGPGLFFHIMLSKISQESRQFKGSLFLLFSSILCLLNRHGKKKRDSVFSMDKWSVDCPNVCFLRHALEEFWSFLKYHISIIAVHQMKWSSVASGHGNSLVCGIVHYIFYVRIRWMAKSHVHVLCVYFDPTHFTCQL